MKLTVNTDLLGTLPVNDINTVVAQAESEMAKEAMAAKVYNVCGIDVIIAKTTDKMLMLKIAKGK